MPDHDLIHVIGTLLIAYLIVFTVEQAVKVYNWIQDYRNKTNESL